MCKSQMGIRTWKMTEAPNCLAHWTRMLHTNVAPLLKKEASPDQYYNAQMQ